MCNHETAVITIRHIVEQTFDIAGRPVLFDRKGKPLKDRRQRDPEQRIVWDCADCGSVGSGSTTGADLPAWLISKLDILPIVR